MDRITFEHEFLGNRCWEIKGTESHTCKTVCQSRREDGCDGCPISAAFDRLAAYEDSGLTPEEISNAVSIQRWEDAYKEWAERESAELNELKIAMGDMTIERLRDLARADAEHRCILLEVPIGTTIYRVVRGTKCRIEEVRLQKASEILRYKFYFGVYDFFTREEAEAVLQEEASDDWRRKLSENGTDEAI